MSPTPENSRKAPENTIEVKGLKKNYGAFQAVKDVSFNVHKGEIVGFLGPNGAGKSTVMKILTCYMAATEGQVRVAGYDVYQDNLMVRRKVGYQPENVPLYDEMVVYDYLKFMARMRGVGRNQRNERVAAVAKVCGLTEVMAKLIRELSKGYRQRVGLAQALIHDPEVIILDEPMSGLDPNQIIEIRDLIKDIGRTKTIIFSSHILQEIEKICDRILIIDRGRLVADGTLGELTAELEGRRRFEVLLKKKEGVAESAVKRAFEGIAQRVQTLPLTDPTQLAYRLTADEGQDLRPLVVEVAGREGFTLIELKELALSLEEIFRVRTGRDHAPSTKATAAPPAKPKPARPEPAPTQKAAVEANGRDGDGAAAGEADGEDDDDEADGGNGTGRATSTKSA